MAIKDLKTAVLAALEPKFKKRGFKLQKSRERFAKRVADGPWWFVLDFTIYESLHVKPAMGLRDLGGHLKSGHTGSAENRPTEPTRDRSFIPRPPTFRKEPADVY